MQVRILLQRLQEVLDASAPFHGTFAKANTAPGEAFSPVSSTGKSLSLRTRISVGSNPTAGTQFMNADELELLNEILEDYGVENPTDVTIDLRSKYDLTDDDIEDIIRCVEDELGVCFDWNNDIYIDEIDTIEDLIRTIEPYFS